MGERSPNEERRSGSRRAVMREREKQEQVRRESHVTATGELGSRAAGGLLEEETVNLPQNRMNSKTEYELLIHPGSAPSVRFLSLDALYGSSGRGRDE